MFYLHSFYKRKINILGLESLSGGKKSELQEQWNNDCLAACLPHPLYPGALLLAFGSCPGGVEEVGLVKKKKKKPQLKPEP